MIMLSTVIFFCHEPSSRLPFLLEHHSANSFSGPANFFSFSLSVPAFFLPSPNLSSTTAFFIFSVHFTCSLLLHIHSSNASSRFCTFRRSAQVSAPYNATLHTKHYTSLFLRSFLNSLQKMLLFLLKAYFHIAIVCFTS